MGSSSSVFFPLVLPKYASLGEATWLFTWTRWPSVWLPFSPDHFLHPLQEAVSVLRVLGVLNPHINFLGKNLVLNLLVYNDAHFMQSDLVNSSGLVSVNGAFLWEQHPLPWCLRYYPSGGLACVWPKEQLRSRTGLRTYSKCPFSFALCLSFCWVTGN